MDLKGVILTRSISKELVMSCNERDVVKQLGKLFEGSYFDPFRSISRDLRDSTYQNDPLIRTFLSV